MKSKIEKLKIKILAELELISDEKALRDLEVKYLGRKGELTAVLRSLSALSDKEKREMGQLANQIKTELQNKFLEVEKKISANKGGGQTGDITLPGEKISRGHLHPITLLQRELEDMFSSMGFMVLDGPELESDYYNFEGLNIPKHHPARDMQDTFYIARTGAELEASDMVMRTHTSPVQVRAMQKYGAPLRCIVPGRTFRNEAIDASHEHTFYQLEGLMVGKDISMANLIAVMKELLKGIFKKEMKVRVRPGYFPFVEPGIELDCSCAICDGEGCPVCKHSGWVELMPAGLVHPNVLKHGGIDPGQYSGFAFGLGLTRMAMMRYGIDDIRLLNSGDLKFLKQF